MAKQDNPRHNSQSRNSSRIQNSPAARWWAARLFPWRRASARREYEHEGRSRLWWRLIASIAVLWWLAATAGDALLDAWWLRDAQGAPEVGLPGVQPSAASTWSLDYLAAHVRLEIFRWGGSVLGALACGGWAWRQGRLAVGNARESEASLGALWSANDAGLATLAIEPHQTGRWIPLEDKLALDRFRGAALRVCVGLTAIIGAILGGRAWTLWLSFWASRPLGRPEPWLGADLSFYLFRLPALDFAWRLLMLAHAMALALALAIYLYEDSLQVGRRLWASTRALRHIAVLLALCLAWKAVGALLYPFELLVSRSPSWSGPHAVDWLWRVPLNFASALAALLCAALCLREARRNRPRQVLGWSLAPLALSWLAVSVLPSMRQATLSPATAAREDAPFAQAQSDWTLLALGFGPNSLPTDSALSLASASTGSPPGSWAAQARLALPNALSERDIALWAHSPADASGMSAAPAPDSARAKGQAPTSTWGSAPSVVWQQAAQSEFKPRTWDERHLDVATSVTWKRFAIQRPERPERLDDPAASSPAQAGSGFTTGARADSVRLQPLDERQLPFLVGIDRADSPGLLLDAEVAEAMATGAMILESASRSSAARSTSTASGAGRERGRPASFFGSSFNSFDSDASMAGLGEMHSLPLFRVLGAGSAASDSMRGSQQVGSAQGVAQGAAPGVALDAGWKKWLAGWRLGSLGLARSERVGLASRLAWRLDAVQRCRSLAPFLSWPDAPRPLLDDRGQLFWLLDGYTLSAAFPLARPLDTASAFAAPEPDLGQSRAPAPQPGAPLDSQAQELRDAEARKLFVMGIMRREEVLSRVARSLDGFNWARASVQALVDAETGVVRLFPMHPDDPILSLYRRALPELWSRPQALPTFARAALRTPPHLAGLQSAAWANTASASASTSTSLSSASGSAATAAMAATAEARPTPWRINSFFFLPTAQGLRTGVLQQAAPASGSGPAPAPAPSAEGASTWAIALAPAVDAQARNDQQGTRWQAHFLASAKASNWSGADALVPLESGPDPQRWLARHRLSSNAASTSGVQPQSQAASSLSAQAWQQARDLWRREKQARSRGDQARERELSRQMERMLEHNAQPN